MPKKKISSAKKLRRQHHDVRPKAPPPPPPPQRTFTASELAAAAEQALHTGQGHPWQAIALYDAAYNKLCGGGGQGYFDISDKTTDVDAATHILEKRAEVKVSLSDQDGARADYQQALELLLLLLLKQQQNQQQQSQQQSQSPPDDERNTNQMEEDKDDNDQTSTSSIQDADPAILERIASLHLYMGQLSQGTEALKCYQDGIQALQNSLQRREQTAISADEKDDDKTRTSSSSAAAAASAAIAETRQQLAAACCSAAEVYLTDLCMEDNAEQECEALIQQALAQYIDDFDGQPTTDALQTAASLRLSQCRGAEAVDFILRCYSKIQPGCCALAALVGIIDENDDDENDDDDDDSTKPPAAAAAGQNDTATTTTARELTNVEAVQSLPGFEFRCQTAKILLECAGFLKEQQQQEEGKETTTSTTKEQQQSTSAPTQPQPGDNTTTTTTTTATMKRCVQAAINVLASLLAENDEVIEIWFLLGDAYAALPDDDDDDDDDDGDDDTNNNNNNNSNMELAQHYWTRTLEMLQTVKDSLEEQSMEEATTSSIISQEEEEDDLQQQLDEILCQMDDVRCKLSEIDIDDTTTTRTTDDTKSPAHEAADASTKMEE